MNGTSERRELAGRRATEFFEALWRQGDFWRLESSDFERARLDRQQELLEGRSYPRALEIGCGAGVFTRRLASLADRVVALDVAPSAVEQARRAPKLDNVDFRIANVMDADLRADGPFDLVVLSETIYYLGWLYPFFDVAWLASELYAATATGGWLLLANTEGELEDALVRPWIIRTYRDLFVNVGYELEHEEVFRGEKDGIALDVLISLFATRPGRA
jgi:SAM-dependent methyltransferase